MGGRAPEGAVDFVPEGCNGCGWTHDAHYHLCARATLGRLLMHAASLTLGALAGRRVPGSERRRISVAEGGVYLEARMMCVTGL